MFQIIVVFLLYILLALPFGYYVYTVADFKKTWLDKIFDPIDSGIYRLAGVNTRQTMNWKKYALSLIATNTVMMGMGYVFLRLQNSPIFHWQGGKAISPDLSLHTIISFMTNTNLQHYAGESTLSNFSQMAVITFMMFVSAASGYTACLAFIRGLCGRDAENVGHYFVDMTRIITRVLLPVSLIGALILVWQGVPQNLEHTLTVQTLEGYRQAIPTGPVASMEIIKHLGTNGGGFLNANAATPIENPTILTNLVELISMTLMPTACVITFGKMLAERNTRQVAGIGVEKRKKKAPIILGGEGRSIFLAMIVLVIISTVLCIRCERQAVPSLSALGVNQTMGNMEGKECRFGADQSALFSAVTTSFTTGSVNNMHDSLTPMGGLITMLNMMMNVAFGGTGVGLMNMVMYAIVAVFICGLMIGRTPEYLGKKIEGKEMKLAALCLILHPVFILLPTAYAVSVQAGTGAVTNPGFHGFSQMLYEMASAAANNGSGFEGLGDHTIFWNVLTGLVMLCARYLPIIIQMAIAGSLMKKNRVRTSAGTLYTDNAGFSLILIFVVFIFAALTFFPVLALGPVAEHLTLFR